MTTYAVPCVTQTPGEPHPQVQYSWIEAKFIGNEKVKNNKNMETTTRHVRNNNFQKKYKYLYIIV